MDKSMSFLKQQLVRVVMVAGLVLAFSLPAHAQDLKIGVVDMQALMQAAPQTTAAMTALQREFEPQQRELQAKQTELQELVDRIEKDQQVMSETERRNAERDFRDLQRDVERLGNELREDLNVRQNEELAKLQRAILTEVQTYAQENGYDLIVGDGILYVNNTVNITKAVLDTITANYQAANAQ